VEKHKPVGVYWARLLQGAAAAKTAPHWSRCEWGHVASLRERRRRERLRGRGDEGSAKFLFSLGKEAVGIRRKGAALLSGHVARPSCLRRGVRVIARVRLTSPLHVSGTCDGTANA